MSRYDEKFPVHREDRNRPIGYELYRKEGNPLFVPGHYESPCGGCDTLNGLDYIFSLINDHTALDFDVIFEGLIVASDVVRATALKEKNRLIVIMLNTDLETCLAGVQSRRDARGDVRPLNPANTRGKLKGLLPQIARFKSLGVDFHHINRQEALNMCVEAFQLGDPCKT
jgi:hypothetical protein